MSQFKTQVLEFMLYDKMLVYGKLYFYTIYGCSVIAILNISGRNVKQLTNINNENVFMYSLVHNLRIEETFFVLSAMIFNLSFLRDWEYLLLMNCNIHNL
jgi:hypothetical protein